MRTISSIVTLLVTLAFCSSAMASRICSIGWYKNNGFDTWYDTCVSLDGAAVCEGLVDDLNARGDHAGDTKNAAGNLIVIRYVGVGNESCEEAD